MSVQAMSWVLDEAPGLPHNLVAVLMALANYADKDGRNAFPSQSVIAGHVRKSERMVRKDLQQLRDLKLIVDGDQRAVAHHRPDKRPVVWDLCIDRKRSEDVDGKASGRKPSSTRKTSEPASDRNPGSSRKVPPKAQATGTTVPPDKPDTGGTTVPGGTTVSSGGNHSSGAGGTRVPPIRQLNRPEPTAARAAPAVTLIRAVTDADEDEAEHLLRLVHERNAIQRSETGLIRAMNASGSLAEYLGEIRAAAAATRNRLTHAFAPDFTGDCTRCPLPADHPKHLHVHDGGMAA